MSGYAVIFSPTKNSFEEKYLPISFSRDAPDIRMAG